MPECLSDAISEAARRLGATIGVAESLTGGLLANAVAVAPQASDWFRGGIVAYSREVKEDLLGVRPGPLISEQCASQMAVGAAKVLGADVVAAVTGVGGPGPEEGQPPGTVWIAISSGGELRTYHRRFPGQPAEVCRATVEETSKLLIDLLRDLEDRRRA